MLTDTHNRKHDYLRISLTDACNIRCTYCMPEHAVFAAREHLMRSDEIIELASCFVRLGVRKIRLTGGEPLVRPDLSAILRGLALLRPAGLEELTMTTNGIRLHEVVDELENAGMRSVNVSLDTLMPERFREITRRDDFHRVLSNIHLLLDRSFRVKVNVVVMNGVNDDEVVDFVTMTRDYPLHVRFIEYMPFEGNRWTDRRLISSKELLERVSQFYSVEPLERNAHDTSRAFKVMGYSGTFAFISTMSTPFCGDCNRLRLTADGKMKNCLFSKGETDLLSALRNGTPVEVLIRENLSGKAAQWGGQDLYGPTQNRPMVSIGG
ncbi:MAG: GTP 3',8-cyclase MoaA [Candidatus Pollutiaquabacter aromativorans]|uniref:GTP 3',8-cyclase MoaA n=1 Tax=Candidatus Pollutiaquabacter sp. TaxID=3416354 RepID=UPI001A4F6347|nr:GTP 3',8-cyclase MoaA [Bacteroidota bacterium]MBL7949206.1 GTP 3',8-cyclase MoaA [Bacteroidia bacterium]